MTDFSRIRLVWEPRILSICRVVLGLLFFEHGTAKLLDFPHQATHQAFDLLTLNPGVQGLIELVGGFLFLVGLFTRPVAFVLAGDVAVAYFMAHAPRGFFPLLNGGELAVAYCFAFLYFWIAGGGVWSLDWLFAPAQAHRSAIPRPPVAAETWRVGRVPPRPEPVRPAGRRAGAAAERSAADSERAV